jgi:predicted dithiol-disulfide oxidoreductase (DUF899 family)
MNIKILAKRVRRLEARLVRDHQSLAALKRRLPREEVRDYVLAGHRGPAPLSTLFGGRRDLIVVHNMGRSCRYCTLWADGFNGLLPHLTSRAALAVVSPDAPAVQQKFAKGRGWGFPMYSGQGSTFIADMGFMDGVDPLPGVSTFALARGKIFRVASAPFGPFDPFCSVWHFFALLADGVDDWSPKYRY